MKFEKLHLVFWLTIILIGTSIWISRIYGSLDSDAFVDEDSTTTNNSEQMPTEFHSSPNKTSDSTNTTKTQARLSNTEANTEIDDGDQSSSNTIQNKAKQKNFNNRIDFALLSKTMLHNSILFFPDELADLNNKEVELVGFMAPYDSLNEFRRMVVLPFSAGCNFCAPPSPVEIVYVEQRASKADQFYNIPIQVTGKLKLWEKDSTIEAHKYFLFFIEDATIKPLSADALPHRNHQLY